MGYEVEGRSTRFAECPGHHGQESKGPEGGARKERGRRQLPSNKQKLEKGGGREGDSVAHHGAREKERAWALMRLSLNLKKGSKEAACH